MMVPHCAHSILCDWQVIFRECSTDTPGGESLAPKLKNKNNHVILAWHLNIISQIKLLISSKVFFFSSYFDHAAFYLLLFTPLHVCLSMWNELPPHIYWFGHGGLEDEVKESETPDYGNKSICNHKMCTWHRAEADKGSGVSYCPECHSLPHTHTHIEGDKVIHHWE